MDNQNQWIDQMLDSLEEVKSVQASPDFKKRMETLVLDNYQSVTKLNKTYLLAIAASFAMLLAANMMICMNLLEDNTSENYVSISDELQEDSYLLIPTKNIYHE